MFCYVFLWLRIWVLEVKSCGSFASKSGLTSKKSYRKTDGNQPRERVHEHRMGSKDGHMDGSFKDWFKVGDFR